MVENLHLLLPQSHGVVWSLPLGEMPQPSTSLKKRKLPNGTILVKTEAKPNLIWKLTPWEKAERLTDELAIYAHLLSGDFFQGWVQLLGIGASDQHFARAYDHAPFGELPHYLRNSGENLSPETIRHILAQIAASMAALHARHIVHRDLKAENVLVFSNGSVPQVKLSDFDRSIELTDGSFLEEPVGSLFHMAPELLAWKPYDRRVDIYAFGMLIFELVNGGKRLWPQVATGMPDSLTANEFAHKVIDEGLRPEWHYQDDNLHALTQRCLSNNPQQRPEFDEICAILAGEKILRRENPAQPPHTGALQSLGIATTIGGQRHTQEDALCILDGKDTKIFAVFDGFKSPRIATFAAQALALILADCLKEEENEAKAIKQAFAQLQAKIARLDLSRDNSENTQISGCTATIAIVRHKTLTLGWVGDSPAFLLAKDKTHLLTHAHSPESANERERIEAAGGIVRRETRMLDNGDEVPWGPLRVYNAEGSAGIAVTRALGALSLQPIISSHAETMCYPVQDTDTFLVLCSDGVSNLLSMSQMQTICLNAPHPQQAATQIITQVEELGSPDNASIIIVKI